MLHIPILRGGRAYESIEKTELLHHATAEPVAQLNLANPGLITRDINRMDPMALQSFEMGQLLAICKSAGRIFMTATLNIGDQPQTFDDYIRDLSATTGMPMSLCRTNANKIFRVLHEMNLVLAGLTRGFDLSILDKGFGNDRGRTLSWIRQARVFGAVLPSNSPGVHSLWLPALALKTPTVLKPGREEPWTPYRLIESFAAAGLPREALCFYPTDHGGTAALLSAVDRAMLFGDGATTRPYRNDPRIQLHGPGFSKVILGADAAENWNWHIDVIVSSILANGGRSCINASAVWTPRHAREIADELGRRLAEVKALPADDPQALIAAFANPATAQRISATIDRELSGGTDLTEKYRGSPRLVQRDRCDWLLPTIISCPRSHPLANREFLFPYASVIECPQEDILAAIGPTLVATIISEELDFLVQVQQCSSIDRLNVGSIPTWQISWDQPHEGNLFELLYRQRAFQLARA
jgi:hypothetical protein